MFKNILQKFGKVYVTILLSCICIVVSVIITTTVWILMKQPNLSFAIIISFICPSIIAPPVIYFYSKLSKELESNRQQLEQANKELQSMLLEVKELSGLLPICASCKNIRDDKGYWNQIESYIRDHSKAEFTHGICPDCAEKLYPGLDLYNHENEK